MATDVGCFHEASFIDQDGVVRTSKMPVVQELMRQGLTHLPDRFKRAVQPSSPPLTGTLAESDHVPFINVSKLRVGSEPMDRVQELAKLVHSVKEWGVFLVTEHGIPSHVLDGVKNTVKGFFGLSFEEKKGSVGSYANVDNMGYGRSFVKSENQPLDWVDRLAMQVSPKGSDQGLNVWPQRPANFRQEVEKYAEEARKVLDELLQALAEALLLERDAFYKYFDPAESEVKVRINFYPRCPRPDLALGLAPHSDASVLTFIMQFESGGGLQVYKNNKWVTVPWPKETLLVNIGDLLEIMSGGKLQSTWHRAATQSHAERYSLVLFYNPPSSVDIEPAWREDEDEDKRVYKKVNVGEYVKNFYKIAPTPGKDALEFAKVC
ncbi:Non-hem dioxygenase N-terminal domain [Dillenia turbinata]|uniref:Non-hem dioxygenase N-terminal domain n=1 Tax=Dillenia turbinata TaxID=194707 RepID=A0AAN8UVP2_9MAGN